GRQERYSRWNCSCAQCPPGSITSQGPSMQTMTKFRAAVSVRLGAALGAVLFGLCAHAQDYPSRPVRIVVPFAPGGPNDIIVRLVAQKLTETWGQPFVVENRPGAGGNIGTDFVAKAAPDGYTLLSVGPGSLIINPLIGKVPYDTARDFAPVTLMARAPNALVAHPSLPAGSVKELIELARSQPGRINYGSGGNGSTPHLAGALFAAMAGIALTHVPYKGTAPATADLIGGQVQIAFLGIPTVLPHVKSGKLHVRAVDPGRHLDLVARRQGRGDTHRVTAAAAVRRRCASITAKMRLPRCRIRDALAVKFELFHN